MKTFKAFCFMYLIMIITSASSALRCYNCVGCGDSFDTSKYTATECPANFTTCAVS